MRNQAVFLYNLIIGRAGVSWQLNNGPTANERLLR